MKSWTFPWHPSGNLIDGVNDTTLVDDETISGGVHKDFVVKIRTAGLRDAIA
jgi:hypothetical protein